MKQTTIYYAEVVFTTNQAKARYESEDREEVSLWLGLMKDGASRDQIRDVREGHLEVNESSGASCAAKTEP